jgi:hypothetical protein
MKIQNAPLAKEQLERIQRLVLDMNNLMACSETTGIDQRTIRNIMEREWASVEHIESLMKYCDGVENFSTKEDKAA